MTSVFHKILRAVAGAMEIPDVVFLVLALGFAVFSVGWLICEYFTEHRKFALLSECTSEYV